MLKISLRQPALVDSFGLESKAALARDATVCRWPCDELTAKQS